MSNDQSSDEKIIDVKRVIKEKTIQPINFYAALGVSILVVVTLALSTLLMMFMASNSWYGPLSQLLEISAVVALLGLFFSLPVLLTSKYGWRTVVTTLLLQSLLVFFTVFIVSLFSTDTSTVRPVYGGYGSELGAGVAPNAE